MIVTWNPIAKLADTVKQIVEALANRLTAAENFGPEGELGQFLGSNGPDSPPSYKDIGAAITSNPATVAALKGDPGPAGPSGAAGPAGVAGSNGMMPTFIADGETFTIPEHRQGLWKEPVIVDTGGFLHILGALVEVD